MPEAPIKTCNTCGRKFMTPRDFLSNTSRWRICDNGHLWFNCSCLSTGIILKGKFPWYNPSERFSPAAESVFNLLPGIKDFPRIPNYVMELQQLMENENATTKQMADVVEHDSLLAATILKVTNSMKPRNSEVIHTLSHAIAFMGVDALRDLVTVAAVSRFKLNCKDFKAEQFWEESFLIGRIAEYLVQKLKLNLPSEQAFLAGSCCNIGKIVLAICQPEIADLYTRELRDRNTLGSWSAAERRHQGFQHTILGEIGAAFWGFPEELLECICMHHDPSPAVPTTKPFLWEVVAFANQLAHWVSLEPHQIDQNQVQTHMLRFSLNQRQIEELVEDLLKLRKSA